MVHSICGKNTIDESFVRLFDCILSSLFNACLQRIHVSKSIHRRSFAEAIISYISYNKLG